MSTLAFVDIETIGLDHRRHQPWEIGLILRSDHYGPDTEHSWNLLVDLGKADPMALTVSRFYERSDAMLISHPARAAEQFARLTHNAVLIGANPAFDAGFLEKWLRDNGACPGWHYRVVDVEAMAIGYLAARDWSQAASLGVPWHSNALFATLGLDLTNYERHTALGDCRLVRDAYDKMFRDAYDKMMTQPAGQEQAGQEQAGQEQASGEQARGARMWRLSSP